MDSKKKTLKVQEMSEKAQTIRLKPSTTDYASYVKRTSRAMKETGPASLKVKPSKRLLQLAKPEVCV